MENVIEFLPYEVVEFEWGTAVRHRNGDWEKIFLKPNGQEIDVSELNVDVHEYGIEFF